MTQEELKKLYLDLKKSLELGFVPDDTFQENFRNARINGTLDGSLEELASLVKQQNEPIDLGDFTKDIFKSVSEMEKMVEGTEVSNFKYILKELRSLFGNIEFTSVEKRIRYLNTSITETEKKLEDLRKEKSKTRINPALSELTRATKGAILDAEIVNSEDYLKKLQEAKKKEEDLVKELYNNLKNKSKSEVNVFMNNILGVINKLDSEYRNLELSEDMRDKLSKAIWDTRDKVVVFNKYLAIEENKIKEKIAELSNSVGLAKTSATSVEVSAMLKEFDEKISELSDREKNDVDSILNNVNETFDRDEENKIKNVDDLLWEIKKLNNMNIEKVHDNGLKIIVEDPANLVLPEGFKYDEVLGINNKVDDVTPFISLPVETKRSLNAEPEVNPEIKPEPSPEINPEFSPEIKPEPSPEVKPDIDPNNKTKTSIRSKITKIRKATVEPYVGGAITLGGVGFILASVAGAPALPVAAVVGGASLGIQELYRRMAKKGMVNPNEFEGTVYEQHPEDALAAVGFAYSISNKCKGLVNSFKEYRRKKKQQRVNAEETRTPEVVEAIETPVVPVTPEAPAPEVVNTPVAPVNQPEAVQPTHISNLPEEEMKKINGETANEFYGEPLDQVYLEEFYRNLDEQNKMRR